MIASLSLVAWILATVADLWITWKAVGAGLREANPVLAWAIRRWNLKSALVGDLLLSLVLGGVAAGWPGLLAALAALRFALAGRNWLVYRRVTGGNDR